MASGNDMKAAQETYNTFTKAFAWGAGICFLTGLIVIALIA